MEQVPLNEVIIDERQRKDYGDVHSLRDSILENGLIQPIVLRQDTDGVHLVAGGRRLKALKETGLATLIHAMHFIWRAELSGDSPDVVYRRKAIELEENIRKKDLHWTEVVEAKRQLFELHQLRLGPSSPSGEGFGVRKLAAMLGESPEHTSNDLELASLITKVPSLRLAESRQEARRLLTRQVLTHVAARAASETTLAEDFVQIYNEDFRDGLYNGHAGYNSADLVFTDLPYGVNLGEMSKHQASNLGYSDSRQDVVDILIPLAKFSFEMLKPDRFAVFFFGMNYYAMFLHALTVAGFRVNPVPFIWYKATGSTEQPLRLYANSYDQALVCAKGDPRFIIPGQRNLVQIAPLYSKDHIAQQPVELPMKFIRDMTIEGQVVLDIMAGSGTTGEAALRSKRRVILFEKDVNAYNYAKVRLANVLIELGRKK